MRDPQSHRTAVDGPRSFHNPNSKPFLALRWYGVRTYDDTGIIPHKATTLAQYREGGGA